MNSIGNEADGTNNLQILTHESMPHLNVRLEQHLEEPSAAFSNCAKGTNSSREDKQDPTDAEIQASLSHLTNGTMEHTTTVNSQTHPLLCVPASNGSSGIHGRNRSPFVRTPRLNSAMARGTSSSRSISPTDSAGRLRVANHYSGFVEHPEQYHILSSLAEVSAPHTGSDLPEDGEIRIAVPQPGYPNHNATQRRGSDNIQVNNNNSSQQIRHEKHISLDNHDSARGTINGFYDVTASNGSSQEGVTANMNSKLGPPNSAIMSNRLTRGAFSHAGSLMSLPLHQQELVHRERRQHHPALQMAHKGPTFAKTFDTSHATTDMRIYNGTLPHHRVLEQQQHHNTPNLLRIAQGNYHNNHFSKTFDESRLMLHNELPEYHQAVTQHPTNIAFDNFDEPEKIVMSRNDYQELLHARDNQYQEHPHVARAFTQPLPNSANHSQNSYRDAPLPNTLAVIKPEPKRSAAESPMGELTDKLLAPFKSGIQHIGDGYVANTVVINISGKRFETTYETLGRYPSSLLGNPEKRDRYWNPVTQEYFFERNRSAFASILYIYQTDGYVRRPSKVPLEVYHAELRFFRLPPAVMNKFWKTEGFKPKVPPKMPSNDALKQLWQFLEYPNSSTWARIFAVISTLIIVVACMSFVVETIPGVQHTVYAINASVSDIHHHDPEIEQAHSNPSNVFHIIEMVCICFFTLELLLKFIACPSKKEFLHEFLTWVDILAIAPFYITLAFPGTRYNEVSMGFAILRVVRLLHIFHILKISQYSRGLQTLGLTFYAGFRELLLLVTVVVLMDLLFAIGIYLAEYHEDQDFKSIPDAMWFGITTMTTVGYGDMIPQTTMGRFIGSLCAITGLLVISLPIPVVVKNFKHFYRQECELDHVNDLVSRESDKVELTVMALNWLKH